MRIKSRFVNVERPASIVNKLSKNNSVVVVPPPLSRTNTKMYEAVPDGGVTVIMPTRRNKLTTYGEDEDDDLDSADDDYSLEPSTTATNLKFSNFNHTILTNNEELPHNDDVYNKRYATANAINTTPLHRRLPSPSPTSSGDSPRAGAGARTCNGSEPALVHVAERDRKHHIRRYNSFNNNNRGSNINQHMIVQDNNSNPSITNIGTINERGNHNNINCKVQVMATDPEEHNEPQDQNDIHVKSSSNESNGWTDRNDNGNGLHERYGWNERNDRIAWNERNEQEENCCVGIGDRVDIEQIKLERYKNKTKSIGVQTTHLSPYRLRFWPVAASIKCLDASFMDVVKCCLRTLSQWFLSQVGLTCVLIVWALLGATAFYKAEGPREHEQAEQINLHKNDIAIDLATDLRQLKEGSDAWPATIEKYLNKHESLLLQAVSSGYVEGGGSIWTYPGCILFAVLLLTTLGFGAPVPRTSLGRGMAVLFSAVGIPLHFMLILNVSNLIAKRLQNLATIKPSGEVQETKTKRRLWYKWFPPFVAVFYYILGVICFGVLRKRSIVECLMFALDFTESGGVANTDGYIRIFYALYIEMAVIIAATIMSTIQVSTTNGIIDLGLRLGLLTNT